MCTEARRSATAVSPLSFPASLAPLVVHPLRLLHCHICVVHALRFPFHPQTSSSIPPFFSLPLILSSSIDSFTLSFISSFLISDEGGGGMEDGSGGGGINGGESSGSDWFDDEGV